MSAIEQMFGLADKTVIITGGAGVIAGALAEAYLQAGARVALWGHRAETLEEARGRLAEASGRGEALFTVVADTAREEAVGRALEASEAALGAPNVLVNGVGGNRGKAPFIETDLAQFESVLALNLLAGLVVPTKVVSAWWIGRGIKGAIINLASMGSYVPLSGVWAYNAAKAAVMNLTVATAREFAPHGIRVNAIAPGFFLGKQNKALLVADEASGKLTPRGEAVIAHTPFGRFGEARELGGAAIFLASERAAGFVTGVTLPVDGGYLTHNI